MRRAVWAAAVVLVAAAIPIGLAAAQPGDLDPTFSGDGWVRTYDITGFTGPYTAKGAEDVVIQPDGKILTVGEIKNRGQLVFGALRWTPTGDLDRSFGDAGWATTHLGEVPIAHAVALQPDGKILVAGEVDFDLDVDLAGIARFNRDGSLDRSFGNGGVVHSPNAFGRYVYDVAVQRDGKIVTVGKHISTGDRHFAFAVSRYLPNGALDQSFSHDGRASVSFRSGHETAYAVALQRDGKILVAGSAEYYDDDFAFARLRPNGTLDRTFSRNGLQTVRFGRGRTDRVRSFVIQRNGRIVAAGDSRVLPRYEPSRMALVRLEANGALDSRFGKRLTSPVRSGGYSQALRVQPDGRILVAGLAYDDADYFTSAWFLTRYLGNGRLDPLVRAKRDRRQRTSARAPTGPVRSHCSRTGRSSSAVPSTRTTLSRVIAVAESRPQALRNWPRGRDRRRALANRVLGGTASTPARTAFDRARRNARRRCARNRRRLLRGTPRPQ